MSTLARSFVLVPFLFISVGLLGQARLRQENIKNDSKYIGKKKFNWRIYVDAPQPVLNSIRCVQYTLHKTFKEPIQNKCNAAATQFGYSAIGWGEFSVKVKVTYLDNREEYFEHWLKLFN
ncbi:hypothetical protein KK083_08035 [Fulvivirgaceae bacterium PWU4]|uniref:YEATS domain-containing protein n=1 Tax=Chryseosolibacter histidini TaxID=2782349 RepID=A0AAP2GNT0_9BACT|nr:pYEATS domain-containing protein [Chryseosolibacter histidini]MBT1696817.1 hypothetical protein [Chryseosolibacter histidini]